MLHLRPPKSVLVTIGKTADHNGYGKTKNEHAKQCAKTTDEFALHATCTQFIFELASILAGGPCKNQGRALPEGLFSAAFGIIKFSLHGKSEIPRQKSARVVRRCCMPPRAHTVHVSLN